MRAVGIDTGARTAIVSIIADRRDTRTWAFGCTKIVAPSSKQDSSVAENKGTLYTRTLAALLTLLPDLIVIEEPSNAAAHWGVQKGGRMAGAVQARGTLFTVGEHYGLVLGAAVEYVKRTGFRIYSHPPTTHKGRQGWMGGGRQIPPRAMTLERMRLLGRSIGADPATLEDEDALMALGVLNYHLNLHLP